MNWLPPHEAELVLTHNTHKSVYNSAEEYIEDCGLRPDFVSPEDYTKAIETDSVWVLQWYPRTPVGFYRIAASTLDIIREHIQEEADAR